jgi:hypothetical protein
MADTLIIRISGEIDSFEEALDKAGEKTEGLQGRLEEVAKTAAIAFAALTAEIGLSIEAYSESEKVSRRLSTALDNQGISSKKLTAEYKLQAKELEELTGIHHSVIADSQAVLTAYTGQTEISKELTAAILDLATAKGIDTAAAAEFVGKGIQGQVVG